MGRICTMHRRHQRERQQLDCETIRGTKSNDRREMARFGDNRVCLCRHSPVLLPLCEGAQTEQAGHRTTTSGMVHAEGSDTASTSKVSGAGCCPAVLDSIGPSELGGGSIVHRMHSISIRRTVTFDKRITVYLLDYWAPELYRAARKGPWMQLAVDRHRFKRRIQLTEVALGNIFTDIHRDKMWFYVNKLCV